MEDLAFQKSEPYRNLIMVLEEKLKASRDAEDALRLAKEHWDQSEAPRALHLKVYDSKYRRHQHLAKRNREIHRSSTNMIQKSADHV